MFGEIELFLCAPRGFCGGVIRAVKIVEETLQKFGSPIYVYHEIVHNKHIIKNFKESGVVFIEDLSEVVDSSRPVIFSAHGVPLDLEAKAKQMNLIAIDATCPLVKKVHRKVCELESEAADVIIIGKKSHQEIIGTTGQLKDLSKAHLIGSVADVEKLSIANQKVGYVTQTTLSVDETKEIIAALQQKFPRLSSLSKSDICYATTERQRAVKTLSQEVEVMIIIGSKNSSNSNKLREVALGEGVAHAILIDDVSELNWQEMTTFSKIGISSGASAPEYLVEELVSAFKKHYEKIKITDVKL
ncbi:MAG: 4-hydroxy-3-methylbut-2-enyl diphosphate reductase [Alphaproteobacteria bacterium]|nr:4-hydroxy-3-methylbut-2-enyl diphosphate reductase [Alphaproteobacteria bacterium]